MNNINPSLPPAMQAYLIALICRNTRASCLALAGLSMRLWQKGGKSKVELATEMLRAAAAWGLQPKYVLFDSWYAARALFNLLAEVGWKYVARIKRNRLLEGERLNQKWPHRYGQARGHLRRVAHEVKVIKDGKRYWVINDTALSPAQIKRGYRLRQQVEETFRLLKQEFGWGGSSRRKAEAQTAHLHLGLRALCLTQQAALAQGQTVYAFKRDLFRQPIPDQLPFLECSFAAA